SALLARQWLKAVDVAMDKPTFLLFDGLDTGFGNSQDSRRRRTAAVSGLFAYLTEAEAELKHLAFKVLLRDDIWRTLWFENKSHLFGRSLLLQWRDQADYFKTVLKQALRSMEFKDMVVETGVRPEVDRWSDQEVYHAWNLLVGERMKGGKTAFTRNWVWNRLADGNGDHSPRALAQLFRSDYFKPGLKQALRSMEFKDMVVETGVRPEVDRWSDQEVYHAWNLLVGERMKGGKTAFTRNWVWNRLADGNGDHSPRALAQLF